MPYRRTENVVRRLAAREQTILDAAQSIASESGMGAVQIAPVAHRADIAAGTVYRYFPSKNNLIAEVIAVEGSLKLTYVGAPLFVPVSDRVTPVMASSTVLLAEVIGRPSSMKLALPAEVSS